jgi:hypothetical protein
MFDSFVLARKPQKTIRDGAERIVDLAAKTLNSLNIRFQTLAKVIDGEQARPDLVSLRVYGEDSYQDQICKTNGVSNPYSINVDDVLVMPNTVSFSREARVEQEEPPQEGVPLDFRLNFKDINANPNQETAIQRFNQTFEQSVEQLKEDGSGLPPSVADFGDKQFLIRGGQVIFAPNIGKCITNESQPISKGELLARLIKNRML